MSTGTAPAQFEPIADLKEAHRFLREAAQLNAATSVWSKAQVFVLESHLLKFSDSSKTLDFFVPKSFNLSAFLTEVMSNGQDQCFASITLPRAALFLPLSFSSSEAQTVHFQTQDRLFRAARRQDQRVQIPQGYSFRVEFNDPHFPENKVQKKLLDVSTTGLSFQVDPEELAFYTSGSELPLIRFNLNYAKIECSAEIRHTSMLPLGGVKKGGKVGVKFGKLKPEDRKVLKDFVAEQARKLFMNQLQKG